MIEIFLATLNQILFLILLIGIGFALTKTGIVKDEASGMLAKLETYIFVPAVVMQSAMENFTISSLIRGLDICCLCQCIQFQTISVWVFM